MCRFLVVKSKNKINPQELLSKFAEMAKKSRAFDGDWQGDGWGFSWLDNNNNWQLYKSTKPVWKDFESIDQTILTNKFAIHARSASFPEHKNNKEFNQPYINEPNIFVFNGLLKGVTISIPGNVGAQKIWNLLQNLLIKYPTEIALEKVKKILLNNTKKIQAMNIAIIDKNNIYALCYYSKHPIYYQLHLYQDDIIQFVCSEPLTGYSSSSISANQIITL
ncbi:MAG: hypothetical protein Q7R95_02150 [bacterium]|nr:hypothetical protein [bacterium]